MNKKDNFQDFNANGRYYASPIEQQILVQGLQRYFSLPERSQNRNKIAKEVSTFLRRFSAHWSHRAVRLWFNNNKHTYFGNSNETMNGMNQNSSFNPNMNINPNMSMNPNLNMSPNMNINSGMNTNINPNINFNSNININTGVNMNIGIGIPNQSIRIPQIPKPPPVMPIIPQPQVDQGPSFSIPIQPPNAKVDLNPVPSVKKTKELPIPIKIQPSPAPTIPQQQHPSQITNIPLNSDKIKPPLPPTPQIINPLKMPQLQKAPPPQIDNPNINTTYPMINSPVYHSLPIPSSNIKPEPIINQQNISKDQPPSLPPSQPQQQSLPEPQIISKIKSPINARTQIQISSPVQVVSPRQTPEKIPLTLPPIKVSEITPNSTNNNKYNTINILNDIVSNSSRNISRSTSIEGKNIVSSPITSQKYIIRPPVQVGSKILFPPIQLENDYSVGSLNNISSPIIPSSSSLTIEPTIDQSYANLARLLKNIQDTDENDSQLEQKISEFDNCINSLKSRCYNIEIDRIEPRLKSTRFPFSREPSTEFNLWNQIPESNSNLDILSDFPMRSPSFTHQFFYATDNASVGHGDSLAATSVWQVRNYMDKKVPYFECSAFGDDIAAYIHLQLQNPNQRVLSFCNYGSSRVNQPNKIENIAKLQNNAEFYNINNLNNNFNDNNHVDNNKSHIFDRQWENILIDCNSRVESMSIDSHYAWLLSDGFVIRTNLDQTLNSYKVEIPSQSGCICSYKDFSSIVASSSTSMMTIITNNLELIQINTSYRGITNVYSMNDNILLTVSLSCMPRLIDSSGKEVRAFIGHCANVQSIALLSPTTFASRADDYTVRIWDIRKREAAMTITTLHNSVINIAGSQNFVVAAFHKKIGVSDIRGSSAKPILGITTEDYDAASLKYNQHEDNLAMFGVIEKENNKDSMLFVGGDGQSRQRIFRIYNDFVGIQND